MSSLNEIIYILEEIEDDNTVSKSIKNKISVMKKDIQGCEERSRSLTINKILSDIEDLSNDVNVPDYVRTQLWHLTSILETIA